MRNLLKGKVAERGYSIRKLARELGRSADYVSQRMRNSGEFKVSEAIKLCEMLGIELSEMHKYFTREE